jgi:hypothetical protein
MTSGFEPSRHSPALAVGAELAVEATAAEVAEMFRLAGIRAILLKGPSLARWLYDQPSTRVSVDVDLLIAIADRARAEGVLAGIGFSPFPSNVAGGDAGPASAWDRDTSPVSVDLHVNLPGVGVSSDVAWTLLSSDTEVLVVRGIEVEVLRPSARAMHVALHAAQHGRRWEWGIEDLSRGLALPFEVWQEAAALARRLDAVPPFVRGLQLVPGGEQLRTRLDLPAQTTVETALRATSPPDLALGLHTLARTSGLRQKARFVARKLFPPASWMRRRVPIARRGNVALVAAYIWRPVQFLFKTPAALRALRKARRESRASR